MQKKSAGFTLIELLVVISIIGLLASVILVSLKDARDAAMYAAAKQEMVLITRSFLTISGAQTAIKDITGSACTSCSCRVSNGAPLILSEATDTSACVVRWQTSLTNIASRTSFISDINGLVRDPWGSPYLLDENELEYAHTPCRQDVITSAGSDRISGNSDDFSIVIPYRTVTCR